jgi:hypothetical protein
VSAESNKHLSQDSRRKIATALLALEGIVVLALGAFLIFKSLTAESVELAPLSGEIFFAAIGGMGLLASASSFKNKRRYGRAPAVLANLIALGVAKYQFEGGLWFVALPLVIVAVTTLYCALTIVPEA